SLSAPRNTDYFTYLRFPEGVRRMIYSTNRVERLNRSYKRTLRMRGALPSADAVLFLLGSVARDMTERTYTKVTLFPRPEYQIE
ncbi:transposase, partial [Porphyromonas sp.]